MLALIIVATAMKNKMLVIFTALGVTLQAQKGKIGNVVIVNVGIMVALNVRHVREFRIGLQISREL